MYEIRIIEDSTGEVVNTFKAENERKASKIEDALYDRVNHDKYSIELIKLNGESDE